LHGFQFSNSVDKFLGNLVFQTKEQCPIGY
jgi:hypothetical protein